MFVLFNIIFEAYAIGDKVFFGPLISLNIGMSNYSKNKKVLFVYTLFPIYIFYQMHCP